MVLMTMQEGVLVQTFEGLEERSHQNTNIQGMDKRRSGAMERGQGPGRGWWQGCLGFEKNNSIERGARNRGCCHNDRSSLVERRVSHLKIPRERNHDTPF